MHLLCVLRGGGGAFWSHKTCVRLSFWFIRPKLTQKVDRDNGLEAPRPIHRSPVRCVYVVEGGVNCAGRGGLQGETGELGGGLLGVLVRARECVCVDG